MTGPRSDHGFVGLIEPDEATRDTLKALLWLEVGVDVVAAASVTELLPILSDETPSLLIVSAEHLPGVVRLRSRWKPRIPVFVLGALAEDEPQPASVVHFSRPVDGQRLVDAVRVHVTTEGDDGDRDLQFPDGFY